MKKCVLNMIKIFSITFIIFSIGSVSFAKAINYYEQPKSDSKLLGTVDSNAGIITIFKPKNSEWIKVADPRNGNVGWIKVTDLSSAGMNFNVISGGDGAHHYQIIQYGNTEPYTADELTKTMQKMQERQKALEKDMQQMMQDMFKGQDLGHFPMILPVVVIPEKSAPTTQKKEATQPATTTQ